VKRQGAVDLVSRAIRSGIFNDLGSGSNVDVAVITKSGTQMMRNYEMPVSTMLPH
jgi:20S proteasome subunit beta 2